MRALVPGTRLLCSNPQQKRSNAMRQTPCRVINDTYFVLVHSIFGWIFLTERQQACNDILLSRQINHKRSTGTWYTCRAQNTAKCVTSLP